MPDRLAEVHSHGLPYFDDYFWNRPHILLNPMLTLDYVMLVLMWCDESEDYTIVALKHLPRVVFQVEKEATSIVSDHGLVVSSRQTCTIRLDAWPDSEGCAVLILKDAVIRGNSEHNKVRGGELGVVDGRQVDWAIAFNGRMRCHQVWFLGKGVNIVIQDWEER